MDNKSSGSLIKTIIFILTIAIACLIFFGLGKENKSDMELVAFGFLMFSALVTYIMVLIPGFKQFKKLEGSDLIACGVLYLLTTIVTNCFFFDSFNDMKTLVIINVIEIIVFIIIFCGVLLRKKR
jgi:hypothetical protein